ncbi:MAG: DUF2817 domain-containing protein [Anaerocolumna sp.]
MKKKITWRILTIVIMVVAIFIIVTPYGMRHVLTQKETTKDYTYKESFYNEYEEVRENLKMQVTKLEAAGYKVEHSEYAIDEADGLYIDNIYIAPEKETKNLVILTTGVHGIEGYIGATMIDVFLGEINEDIDHENTGVLIVSNVNPYGMKYKRRYNENNVDLNRNFIFDWNDFNLDSNTDYPIVEDFLEPKSKIGNAFLHELGFWGGLAKQAIMNGTDTISNALLSGQYRNANGVYYGGNEDQKSTTYLKEVFADSLHSSYSNIVHIDVHSGYGPRNTMTIFNSVYDTMTEEETKAAFDYEDVIASDSEEFYSTTGDTTEYFYRLAEQENPDSELFSTCFEFGTLGSEFLDTVKSLKYTVDENRNNWYQTSNKVTQDILENRYLEMFYPVDVTWREAAVQDFVDATKGVLKAKLQ